MTKLEVLAWLASKGFRGNTVDWLRKHELVSLAEGVWDYVSGGAPRPGSQASPAGDPQ